MSRSKTPLFLTEAVIMLLVFSAVAAVCLRLFAAAREDTRQGRELSCAASWAATAADCYLAAGGQLEETADLLGGDLAGDAAVLGFDAAWEPGGSQYQLRVTAADGYGYVTVSGPAGALFQLKVKAVSGLA